MLAKDKLEAITVDCPAVEKLVSVQTHMSEQLRRRRAKLSDWPINHLL